MNKKETIDRNFKTMHWAVGVFAAHASFETLMAATVVGINYFGETLYVPEHTLVNFGLLLLAELPVLAIAEINAFAKFYGNWRTVVPKN